MNKRDKFWINNLLLFTGLMLIFIALSIFNLLKFNDSYMNEECEELPIFKKQIEWAILPYLERKDYETVQKYCDDFTGKSVKLRLYDSDKNFIASSIPNDNVKVLDENSVVSHEHSGKIWKTYKTSLANKKIGVVDKLNAGGSTYYLELIVSQEDVMKSIIHAQSNIIIFIILFSLFFIFGFIFIIQKLRVPFNRLETSVKKIADGELDTNIDVPKLAELEELALSIKKMTNRLKNQIIRLKQLEQYKTEFLQNVSHEIKTPITAINSAVEFLQNSDMKLKEQDSECFNIIEFQVKFINTLVNDILSLSEIEAEKDTESKSFKIFDLTQSVETLINYTITNDVEINLQTDEKIMYYGDEELITRAIANLLTNAVKYSKSDKIDIILSKDDDEIKIQVKDYGIGIPEEHLPMIFERFYRVDKARSRKSGGTGLGLAIVKNIVELHNGTITVENNQGCIFTIILPD